MRKGLLLFAGMMISFFIVWLAVRTFAHFTLGWPVIPADMWKWRR